MDYGHELRVDFCWRVEDQDIRYAYIKGAMPQLNDKAERLHSADFIDLLLRLMEAAYKSSSETSYTDQIKCLASSRPL